jgi:hypothetical protein
MYHRTIFNSCRAISLLVALMVSGCQSPPPRPYFIAQSVEDCVRGDQSVRSMADALYSPLVNPDAQSRTEPDQIQITRNVAAIMGGIKRARTYSPVEPIEIAPATPPERLQVR